MSIATDSSVPDLDVDPYSDDFLTDPYPHYATLREAGPVVWLRPLGVYAVARHAEVATVLSDWETFTTRRGFGLTDMAVAPALLALGARTPVRLRNPIVQTVTTNIPGPNFPLYMLGRQIVGLHPYVPLTGGIRVGIAIFSYLGSLNFGISADFDAIPDIDVLTDGIRNGFEELLKLADH